MTMTSSGRKAFMMLPGEQHAAEWDREENLHIGYASPDALKGEGGSKQPPCGFSLVARLGHPQPHARSQIKKAHRDRDSRAFVARFSLTGCSVLCEAPTVLL